MTPHILPASILWLPSPFPLSLLLSLFHLSPSTVITFRNLWHSAFCSWTWSWSCLLVFCSLVDWCCRCRTCLLKVLLSVSAAWALLQASFLAVDWEKRPRVSVSLLSKNDWTVGVPQKCKWWNKEAVSGTNLGWIQFISTSY